MVYKMEKVKLEKQGRIIIPKRLRDKLRLREGEEFIFEETADGIRLKRINQNPSVLNNLRGCIKDTSVNPLDLKKIWKMNY